MEKTEVLSMLTIVKPIQLSNPNVKVNFLAVAKSCSRLPGTSYHLGEFQWYFNKLMNDSHNHTSKSILKMFVYSF